MNANCPKCQQQTTFVAVENKKYKCEKCNSLLHKCHKLGCINMVTWGYCSKCIGRGFKDFGAGAITVVLASGSAIAYFLLNGKDKNNE